MFIKMNSITSYLATCFLLAGCCGIKPVETEPVSIAQIIDELKSQLVSIPPYQLTDNNNACKATIKANFDSATVTLKQAINITTDMSGTGNIPTPVVIISPQLSGAYSEIKAQTVTFDVMESGDIKNTKPPVTKIELNKTDKLAIKDIIDATLQGMLEANHNMQPCLKPTKLKIQLDFQVTKKGSAGIALNFVVAKIGANITETDDSTHSLTVIMNLDGSMMIM
jgi:hypothetical protein